MEKYYKLFEKIRTMKKDARRIADKSRNGNTAAPYYRGYHEGMWAGYATIVGLLDDVALSTTEPIGSAENDNQDWLDDAPMSPL